MNEQLYHGCPENTNWGTGVVIVDAGKILLGLRTDNKKWSTPGGRVEVGETPLDAVIRETKEEANVDLNPLMTRFVSRVFSYNEGVVWDSFTFITNYASVGDMKPALREFSELRWIPVNDLPNYDLWSPTIESLAEVFKHCPQYLFAGVSTLDTYTTSSMDQMAELATAFEGSLGIEYDVAKLAEIQKMTSIEQLIGVKNPGRNNGSGTLGSDGNWKYTKPGSTDYKDKNRRLTERRDPEGIELKQKLQKLQQSYIQHFKKTPEFKKQYQIKDNTFSFPDYTTAKQQNLVKDKKSYVALFKEQYVHYALSGTSL